MKLNVLPPGNAWYADGLKFTCTECGNCCTGGPGFVWISREEIVRLAEFLRLTPEETVERHCRKIDGRFSLRERRNPQGSYDCIFLTEAPAPEASGGEGGAAAQAKRSCSVYPVRPLQCRTWPFWPENLQSPEAWKQASRKCHGMDTGRKFNRTQIESLRAAEDWPQRPPTSRRK